MIMNFNMQTWVALLAVAACVCGLPMMLSPAFARRGLRGFCRSRWAGRVLSTLALAWAGWWLYSMPLEFLVPYRKFVPFVILGAIPFAWYAMPDLLSARALGGILALIPAPVLQVARAHPSDWRLVVVALMYLMALAGMTLMMAPYLLRDGIEWLSRTDWRLRASGAARILLGLLLGWLAAARFG